MALSTVSAAQCPERVPLLMLKVVPSCTYVVPSLQGWSGHWALGAVRPLRASTTQHSTVLPCSARLFSCICHQPLFFFSQSVPVHDHYAHHHHHHHHTAQLPIPLPVPLNFSHSQPHCAESRKPLSVESNCQSISSLLQTLLKKSSFFLFFFLLSLLSIHCHPLHLFLG